MGQAAIIGRQEVTVRRPKDSDPCGRCGHPFGGHFTTNDGKKGGCSYRHDDQRDGVTDCPPSMCDGYVTIIRWAPS